MKPCPYCSQPLPGTVHPGVHCQLVACAACMNACIAEGSGPTQTVRAPSGVPDVRAIAPEGSLGRELLAALPRSLDALPILPEVSRKVLTMTRDPDISMRELAEVISNDQAIALKILQMANSAMYGGLHEIRELDAACARLGMKTVANAVQAVANGNLYITGNERFRGLMRKLWEHALATAHCASAIGELLGVPRTDALFVAGLVHDVGVLIILDCVSNAYRGALTKLRDSQELLDELIEGYSALIGLHVVQRWSLPAEFGMATFYRDRPAAAPGKEWENLVHIVSLSNAIAETSGFTYRSATPSLLSHPSTKVLGLTDIKLAILRADLEDKITPLLEISNE